MVKASFGIMVHMEAFGLTCCQLFLWSLRCVSIAYFLIRVREFPAHSRIPSFSCFKVMKKMVQVATVLAGEGGRINGALEILRIFRLVRLTRVVEVRNFHITAWIHCGKFLVYKTISR